ncbi:MAG TPA: hypothetical protein VKR06_46435 [Ktedonosporobacter sp.]|nr:hypothetical protein [Ktedonosporobacter sp.]
MSERELMKELRVLVEKGLVLIDADRELPEVLIEVPLPCGTDQTVVSKNQEE